MVVSTDDNSDSPFIKELDYDINGKSLSKLVIKDIACTSNTLFLATGKLISYHFII